MRSARRLAVGLGLGLLLGVQLLAAPGLAAPSLMIGEPPAQPQVEFDGGGPDLLLCGSRPDRGSVTVRPESRVVFVNNIGQGATLQIDGENGGPIADGQAVEVQFHRGPVAIAMVPDCLLNLGGNGSYEPVTVNVNPTRPTSSGTTGSKSAVKTRFTPEPKPSPTPALVAADPTGDPDPLSSLDPKGAIDPAADPAQSVPAIAEGGGPADRNIDLSGDTPRGSGPIGLLAIIATVCVVGVLVGVIRAIVNEHATRIEFA